MKWWQIILLIEKGITDRRIGKARYWRGIRLRTDADSDILGDKSDKTSGDLASEVTRVIENSIKSLYKENMKKFTENPVTPVTDVTKTSVSDFGRREAVLAMPVVGGKDEVSLV